MSFLNKSQVTQILAFAAGVVVTGIVGWVLLVTPMQHGDINRDGRVNALDLSTLSTHWSK